MTRASIVVTREGFTPYGRNAEAFYSRESEIMLSGPYDTGKTISLLQKINLLLSLHTNARALIVRKTYKSLINSVVVTFEKKVHNDQIGGANYPITSFGLSRPEWYDYPNGARLVLGGMDNPAKTLSSEYDFIYVNQAEELTADDWQALTRACSGRAGNSPYTQIMGDCNPDVPESWILKRPSLHLYESRHVDNPTIFERDNDGQLTGEYAPGGEARIKTLDSMTGIRLKRGRFGLWVAAEGQVYLYDPSVHLIDEKDCPPFIRRYRSIDFGYTNPFVCQWWGEDYDGRLYLYRELYMSQRTVKIHAAAINLFDDRIYTSVADHDAEDRATLVENGIDTITADKRVSVGIQAVNERLKVTDDGQPRLFVVRDCTIEVDAVMQSQHRPTSTHGEFGGYVWPKTKAKRAADERPVKSDDHGMDALRYMVMYFDGKKTAQASDLVDLGHVEGYSNRWQ